MKTQLIALLLPVVALTQTAPKKESASLTDAQRAAFLLVQRDFLQVSTQYESNFKQEPVTIKYTEQAKALAQICSAVKMSFDSQTVQCVASKEVTPSAPAPTTTAKPANK